MFLTLKILLQPESTEGVDTTQTTAMKKQEEISDTEIINKEEKEQ